VNQDKSLQAQPMEEGTEEEQFEQLRQRFHERLRKEQAQLAVLTAALGGANVASASMCVDIRAFAHRLRGAALVFGFQGLGDSAKAVELAATAGSLDASGQRLDPSVEATMRALAINLADEIGAGTQREPAMTQACGSSGQSSS
jgi:hypothetical protein